MKRQKSLYTSVLLVLLALVSVTAATVAWFTIADRTRLRSMSMEITSGASLRFDLDAHAEFDDYVKTLTFDQIADRILQDQGYDMREVPLEPVTTQDGVAFTLEDGTLVESDSGSYLTFTLHFMAQEDMVVHLTSASSAAGNDGTLISSDNSDLAPSMRISFTVGSDIYVYDPGMDATSVTQGSIKTFGLPSADQMAADDSNAMFFLRENVDQAVTVRVWLEGTDERCTDALRGADYAIRLRFLGTDRENRALDGTENS
jgi:hypothetical protein